MLHDIVSLVVSSNNIDFPSQPSVSVGRKGQSLCGSSHGALKQGVVHLSAGIVTFFCIIPGLGLSLLCSGCPFVGLHFWVGVIAGWEWSGCEVTHERKSSQEASGVLPVVSIRSR